MRLPQVRYLVLAAVLALAGRTIGAQDAMEMAREAVNRIIPPGPQQQSARCKLQHALWGRYDLRLYAVRTNDGNPHVLEIRDGLFFEAIDSNPRLGVPGRFERTGRLELSSATEAFRRGVPFFIQKIMFDRPNAIRVTVVSGPGRQVDAAMVVAVIEDPTSSDNVPYASAPLGLRPPVQDVVLEHDSLAAATSVRVAIMRGTRAVDVGIGCLISNEVYAVIPPRR